MTLTTKSIGEGEAKASPDTVDVKAIRPFDYPVIVDGKWESHRFEVGDVIPMDSKHVQRHINANLVERKRGRKKKDDHSGPDQTDSD